MSKSTAVKSSQIQYDGTSTESIDLGLVSHGVGATNGSYSIVPYDCFIAEVVVSIGVTATSASAAYQLGTLASVAAIVASQNVQNVAGGTVIRLTKDSDFVSAAVRNLNKGDIINLNTVAASAVGSVGATIVITARPS
jgi:hypothetical protein